MWKKQTWLSFGDYQKIVGDIIRLIIEHRDKNGKEDLLKARHFIDMLIELEYCGGNETK